MFERSSIARGARRAWTPPSAATSEPLLDAARLAVTMRRTRAAHLERLRAGMDPSRAACCTCRTCSSARHGLRATRQVADALSAELGY